MRLPTLLAACVCLLGLICLAEAQQGNPPAPQKKKKKGGRPGEIITPAAKSERIKDRLKPRDPAPDFTLPDPKGIQTVTLADFRGKQPVVLIFGSYT